MPVRMETLCFFKYLVGHWPNHVTVPCPSRTIGRGGGRRRRGRKGRACHNACFVAISSYCFSLLLLLFFRECRQNARRTPKETGAALQFKKRREKERENKNFSIWLILSSSATATVLAQVSMHQVAGLDGEHHSRTDCRWQQLRDFCSCRFLYLIYLQLFNECLKNISAIGSLKKRKWRNVSTRVTRPCYLAKVPISCWLTNCLTTVAPIYPAADTWATSIFTGHLRPSPPSTSTRTRYRRQ